MTTYLKSTPAPVGIGGVVQEYLWKWENQEFRIVYETLGQGKPLLLLPAFSTVCMRSEMAKLAQLLSAQFQVTVVDFPGFGQSSRPALDYRPALYQQFLQDFVKIFDTPPAVIAAGHSAAYVLQLAQTQVSAFTKIVLVAPTWHGPLPTAMGEHRGWYGILREFVRTPILGQALYKLNTVPDFLSFMYRRHVYADAAKVTPQFIQHKWQTTQQRGARFTSAAFVTGTLDAVQSQADFLNLVPSSVPLLVVIGESTPPKSRAEMDALAAVVGVSRVVPGSLGLHEEYPEAVADAVRDFL